MLPLFLLSMVVNGTVVLDPGHGGYQPGAHAGKGKYEKTLTLQVAEAAKAELIKRGHTVILTRTTDQYVSLGARSRFANEHHADVLVSIHANDAPRSSDAQGIETYFLSPRATDAAAEALAEKENDDPNTDTESGGLLGTILSDLKRSNAAIESELLAARMQGALVRATSAKSRGVKQAPLAVLKRTEMAAILIEIGFLTHKVEKEKLWTASYQAQLANGIADGIERFLNDNDSPELPPVLTVPLISLTNRQKRSPPPKLAAARKKGTAVAKSSSKKPPAVVAAKKAHQKRPAAVVAAKPAKKKTAGALKVAAKKQVTRATHAAR